MIKALFTWAKTRLLLKIIESLLVLCLDAGWCEAYESDI